MRHVSLALALALGPLGCATPPVPPLVESIPGGPNTYQFARFKWESGKKLTYSETCFEELKSGGRTETKSGRNVAALTGVGRTSKGLMRVNLTANNVEVGFLLFDDAGRLQDAVPRQPALADTLKWYVNLGEAQARHLESRVMKQNEEYSFDFSFLIDIFEKAGGFELPRQVDYKLLGTYQYLGYKRIGTTPAAAVRWNLLNIPQAIEAVERYSGQAVRILAMTMDVISYIDANQGFLITAYSTATVDMSARGESVVMRIICDQTLDRHNSGGI